MSMWPFKTLARKVNRVRALPADRLALVLRHRLWQRVRGIYDANVPYTLSNQGLLRSFEGRFKNIEDLAAYGRERPPVVLQALQQNREHVYATLEVHVPGYIARTLQAADTTLTGIVDLLGSGPTKVGDVVDWHVDFKTGWHWPLIQASLIDFHDLEHPYDVKVPWELSRLQLLVTLGQAYWLTRNRRYSERCFSLLHDWIDTNPPGIGVNWACTMDVAIRAVNLSCLFVLLHQSEAMDEQWRITFYRILFEHGRYISRNLEINRVLGNHYLADVVGLAWLGITLPDCPVVQRWKRKGTEEVWKEALHQFYADGVNFESSTSYHRLSLELILHTIILCNTNNIDVPEVVHTRIERALEYVQAYTRGDGSVPQIGDADNGRLLRLDAPGFPDEANDHRYILALGASLYHRPDFAHASAGSWAEAVWVLGTETVDQFENLQIYPTHPPISQAFPHGGIYIQRYADLHAVINASPVGQDGNGGHAHNDVLSFEMHAYGTTFVRDPGAYVYTADYRARNTFRQTKYHNTVEIDGQEQRRIDEHSLFQLHDDVTIHVHTWLSDAYEDIFDASHSGYQRLLQPVTHRRQIIFDKLMERWLVRDIVFGTGLHTARMWLHFGPIIVREWRSISQGLCCEGDYASLYILPQSNGELQQEVTTEFISPSYGVRTPAPAACYTLHGAPPLEIVTIYAVTQELEPRQEDLMFWAEPQLKRLRQLAPLEE